MRRRIRDPRFLLLYPPLQFAPGELVRPDGTLAPAYLDAALTRAGFASRILDCSVGTPADRLEDTFHRRVELPNGMIRIGLSPERILAEAATADVIGITSIFTQQTARCLEIVELVKGALPGKLLVAGGVNARALREVFLDRGVDVVVLSEGEEPMVALARALDRGTPDLTAIPGLALRRDGRTVITGPPRIPADLDAYPIPARHKLPNEHYWAIGRIWGGREGWVEPGETPRYAALLTSRGCPYRCTYCHISGERGPETGDIGRLRLHSLPRIGEELEGLRALGVTHVLINDDSFLAKKRRAHAVLALLARHRFRLADVNGVNIIHLFRRHRGRLVVDEPLLEALAAAGFRKISLPFESGSQRLIDRYSSGKWDLAQCNVAALVRALRRVGIAADGNFMIGYPDETPEELTATFLLARRMMDAGLVGCQFFMVQPFPGSRLFDEALASGQLPPDWHWDDLGWSKGSPFRNPAINPALLKYAWQLVWKLLNPPARIDEFAAQLR